MTFFFVNVIEINGSILPHFRIRENNVQVLFEITINLNMLYLNYALLIYSLNILRFFSVCISVPLLERHLYLLAISNGSKWENSQLILVVCEWLDWNMAEHAGLEPKMRQKRQYRKDKSF